MTKYFFFSCEDCALFLILYSNDRNLGKKAYSIEFSMSCLWSSKNVLTVPETSYKSIKETDIQLLSTSKAPPLPQRSEAYLDNMGHTFEDITPLNNGPFEKHIKMAFELYKLTRATQI